MKNITKKQMVLLTVLIIILILVIVVQYFYRPVFKKIRTVSKEITEMETKLDNTKMSDSIYNVDLVTFKNTSDGLNKDCEAFLPLMKSNELDKLVTNILIESGVKVESLEISDIIADTVIVPYSSPSETEETSEEESKGDAPEVENQSSDITEEITPPEYPPGASVVKNPENGETSLEYKTGEYSCVMQYSLKGTYESIVNAIRNIADNSSLELSSVYFKNDNEISADCVYSAELYIKAYMYKSELFGTNTDE